MSRGRIPALIRLMDLDGEYVGLIALAKAQAMEAQGRLIVTLAGRRSFAKAFVRIDDFDHAHCDAPAYHCAETHAGRTLVTLKRLSPEKSYGAKWDPFLTFPELRQGRIVSQVTVQIQQAARRARAKDAASPQQTQAA